MLLRHAKPNNAVLGARLLPVPKRLVRSAAQVLHNAIPEHPETPETSIQRLPSHNNIRKTERFRNRQVTSSSLVVGSINF